MSGIYVFAWDADALEWVKIKVTAAGLLVVATS